jgi:hypothetical protein
MRTPTRTPNMLLNDSDETGKPYKHCISKLCDGPLTPVTRVRTPLGLPSKFSNLRKN